MYHYYIHELQGFNRIKVMKCWSDSCYISHDLWLQRSYATLFEGSWWSDTGDSTCKSCTEIIWQWKKVKHIKGSIIVQVLCIFIFFKKFIS